MSDSKPEGANGDVPADGTLAEEVVVVQPTTSQASIANGSQGVSGQGQESSNASKQEVRPKTRTEEKRALRSSRHPEEPPAKKEKHAKQDKHPKKEAPPKSYTPPKKTRQAAKSAHADTIERIIAAVLAEGEGQEDLLGEDVEAVVQSVTEAYQRRQAAQAA